MSSTKGQKKVKKTRRYKPGTVALREIRKQQVKTDLAIPRAPFKMLTKEITQEFVDEMRFSANSFDMIQTYIENYLIKVLENSNLNAIHAGRQTIEPKDIRLTRRVMGERN